MFQHNSQARGEARLFLIAALYLIFFMTTMANAFADTSGYVSPNPHDLPPDITSRDVSSQSVDPDRPPAYGPEDAKVLVLIFADFKCPACLRGSQATHQIAGEFPGDVRMEFWNNPFPSHRNTDLAAYAAIAAQRQGKFWEMHDMLFANPKHDVATLELNAQELGLDLDQFRSDMNDPDVIERVRKQREFIIALEAGSTPAYLVNGKAYTGWGSWMSLRGKVERELVEANALAEQGMDSEEIWNQRAIDNNEDSEKYELYRLNVLEPRMNETSD